MLGVGAVTLAAVLTAPDPDPSDHRSLLICAAIFALVATILAVWRSAPDVGPAPDLPARHASPRPSRWASPSRSG